MTTQVADVIVVGAGNAAFCAALAAQEQGAKVLTLEAAPEEESGGNSRFTAAFHSLIVLMNSAAFTPSSFLANSSIVLAVTFVI